MNWYYMAMCAIWGLTMSLLGLGVERKEYWIMLVITFAMIAAFKFGGAQ